MDALQKLLFSYRPTLLPSSDKSLTKLMHGRQPQTLLSLMIPTKVSTKYGDSKSARISKFDVKFL